MIKKLLLIFSLLTSVFSAFSQQKNTLIIGKVLDSLGVVKNANIINLNSNQGTSSNNNGEFRMFVKLGDSVRISTIQHVPKTIAISKFTIENKKITTHLKLNTYQLDEFELKRHNLSGRLGIDTKNVPKNEKDSLLRNVMDFSNVDWNAKVKDDYIDKRVRPQIVNTTPGIDAGFGAGTSFSMPFKYSERLWALRRKLAQKKSFPYKVLSELGEKFFFDELKIPVEKYFHFLEYCNPLGIENLHKDGKFLELIKVLREESIGYLKIIKKE